MQQAATDRQVSDWLTALARLVASNMTPQEAGERLRAYVPELVARFDSRDFNGASREFVARSCRFFPSYGELCELLDKWPRPVETPKHAPPEAADLNAMDRAWVEFWHRRRAEIYAQQNGFKWGSREADLENVASLIRAQSLKAWAAINGVPEAIPAAPSEREVAYVARALRPEPVYAEKSAELPPEPNRPKPAYLSPEVLAQRRPEYGLHVPADEAADA